jgi:hypothetical protein
MNMERTGNRIAALIVGTLVAAPGGAVAGVLLADTTGPDNYVVTLDASASDALVSGRLVLFFVTGDGGRWGRRRPMDAPFFSNPQPIASMEVRDLAPGASVRLGEAPIAAVPRNLGALGGPVRVQALLDRDQTERSHTAGPGNLYSDPVSVELDPDGPDEVRLVLKRRIEPPPAPAATANLRWVRFRSETLSEFYGRPIDHRAGVALPPGYLDPARPEQRWPTVYVIPGYGGRDGGAAGYAEMHATPGSGDVAPQAVFVVLDPESPLGHHGFVDSPNHGPRGTALVEELIPHLEASFRLDARPEARIVTGHSSGGWSSLWLALRWPEVFGACWSSAPDPIDFRAFQNTNIYEDESVYLDASGRPTASFRTPRGRDGERVMMTVRQEALMEYAIHPPTRTGPPGSSGTRGRRCSRRATPRRRCPSRCTTRARDASTTPSSSGGGAGSTSAACCASSGTGTGRS